MKLLLVRYLYLDLIFYEINRTLQKILYVYSQVEGGIDSLNSNANVPNTLVSLITNSKKKGN